MGLFGSGKPVYDYIVAGLGNLGKEYANTRHNAGFIAIDYIADMESVSVNKSKFNALVGDLKIYNKRILLMKPQTFMNNSGASLREAANFYKIQPQNIIIIFDDVSLDVGKIRVRKSGSAGGHNGIKSIISNLGSQDFPRIKIGVGSKPNAQFDLADWVLSSFNKAEEKNLLGAVKDAYIALEFIINGDIGGAMNRVN